MPKARLLLVVLAFWAANALAVDLTKPIAEIALKDGTVLHNVDIRGYSATSILVRHSAGAGSIKYEQLSDELYDAILEYRNVSPTVAKAIPEKVVAVRNLVKVLAGPVPQFIKLESYVGDELVGAEIEGRYSGNIDAGVEKMREFVSLLKQSPGVTEMFGTIKLKSLEREYQTGEMNFVIELKPGKESEVNVVQARSDSAPDPLGKFLRLSPDEQLVALAKGRPRLPPMPSPEGTWSEKALFKPTLAGQLFITTRGGQTFKMSGVTVKVFPKSYAKALLEWMAHPGQPSRACEDLLEANKDASGSVWLDMLNRCRVLKMAAWANVGKGVAETTSDADGKFDIASPYSEYAIFAIASRRISDKTEFYVWLLTSDKVTEKDKILLNGANTADSWTSGEEN